VDTRLWRYLSCCLSWSGYLYSERWVMLISLDEGMLPSPLFGHTEAISIKQLFVRVSLDES